MNSWSMSAISVERKYRQDGISKRQPISWLLLLKLPGLKNRNLKQKKMEQIVNKLSVLLLAPLVMLMSACTTPSPPSAAACPALPLKPLVSQSQPLVPYSQTALDDINRWRQALIGTPVTSAPSLTPGLKTK